MQWLLFVLFGVWGLALLGGALTAVGNVAIIPLIPAYLLAGGWVVLAAAVKRLRDGGNSPWLVLISLIPFIGSLILLALILIPGSTDEPSLAVAPGDMRVCLRCGTANPHEARFCGNCAEPMPV
jgi:uncharacterized membrane protein YhaH (DUF805 family)